MTEFCSSFIVPVVSIVYCLSGIQNESSSSRIRRTSVTGDERTVQLERGWYSVTGLGGISVIRCVGERGKPVHGREMQLAIILAEN